MVAKVVILVVVVGQQVRVVVVVVAALNLGLMEPRGMTEATVTTAVVVIALAVGEVVLERMVEMLVRQAMEAQVVLGTQIIIEQEVL